MFGIAQKTSLVFIYTNIERIVKARQGVNLGIKINSESVDYFFTGYSSREEVLKLLIANWERQNPGKTMSIEKEETPAEHEENKNTVEKENENNNNNQTETNTNTPTPIPKETDEQDLTKYQSNFPNDKAWLGTPIDSKFFSQILSEFDILFFS